MKKNGGGQGMGLLTEPAEGQGGKKDRKMPPTKDHDTVGECKEKGRKEKGLPHLDPQKGKTILEDLSKAPKEIPPKEKFLGKGDEQKMKEKGLPKGLVGGRCVAKMKDENLQKMVSEQNEGKNDERNE